MGGWNPFEDAVDFVLDVVDVVVVVVVVVGPDVPLICIQRLIRPRVDRRPIEATRRAAPRLRRICLHPPVKIISILQELNPDVIIV